MNVHVHFGDVGPDYLVDLLVKGFADAGHTVTWWPHKAYLNGDAPFLRPPLVQGWGGAGAWGRPQDTTAWLAQATSADVLVWTHDHAMTDAGARDVSTQTTNFYGRKIALDTYDVPVTTFRDVMRRFAGFEIVAREGPFDADVIPVDYPFNPIWTPNGAMHRSIPVLFAGDFGVGNRKAYADALRCAAHPGAIVTDRLTFPDWLDALSQSRLVVCPEGAGKKTYRLWEAAAAGCALLVERTCVVAGLVDGENCVFFDDVDDLQAKTQTLVYSPLQTMRLGHAAKEEAFTNHTPGAVARRLLGAAHA